MVTILPARRSAGRGVFLLLREQSGVTFAWQRKRGLFAVQPSMAALDRNTVMSSEK